MADSIAGWKQTRLVTVGECGASYARRSGVPGVPSWLHEECSWQCDDEHRRAEDPPEQPIMALSVGDDCRDHPEACREANREAKRRDFMTGLLFERRAAGRCLVVAAGGLRPGTPVGVGVGLDEVATEGEPVDNRRGRLGVGEGLGPGAERLVGGDSHAVSPPAMRRCHEGDGELSGGAGRRGGAARRKPSPRMLSRKTAWEGSGSMCLRMRRMWA